jgi:hypothetical protein
MTVTAFTTLGYYGRGPVELRELDDGQIEIRGDVPRVVEMSDDLFRDFVAQINELRRLKRNRELEPGDPGPIGITP